MATALDERWHIGIGDPTAIGWFTVVAYAATAWLCFNCYRRYRGTDRGRFWWALFLVMMALGINKQLDLQSWLTEIGRDAAKEYGWYGRRGVVQVLFIAGLACSALLMHVWLARHVAQLGKHARRASVGLLVLVLFVLVRATSFHHVDEWLGFSLDGLSINEILELGGISVIAWAAASRLWDMRSN